MTPIVFLAGLASAILHAIWNAATRARPDPGQAFAGVVIVAGLVSLPPLPFTGLPGRESWPWLAAGAVFNVVTMRLLMSTYRNLPFGIGYPMVRGVAPLGVSLLGLLLFGDRLSPLGLVGVIAISTAVLMLAASSRVGAALAPRGVALALLAGLSNACFTVCDAHGVRVSGNALGYAFVVAVINGGLLAVWVTFEKVDVIRMLRRDWAFALAASTASMGSYMAVLYGFLHGPVGAVSALRETNVFFGILIAATVLKEKVGLLRWTAAFVALFGLVMIRLS